MDSPRTCNGVIELPKMRTEPVMSKISLKTPASVRTRPLPALTRKTAATLSMNATRALLNKISGLRKQFQILGIRDRGLPNSSPDTHNLHEGRKTLSEREDSKVDERANGSIVVERHKRVHLEAV